MATELEMATAEELWKELSGRFAMAVFVSSAPTKVEGNHEMEHTLSYSGGQIAAIGLLEYAKHKILRYVADENRAGDDD